MYVAHAVRRVAKEGYPEKLRWSVIAVRGDRPPSGRPLSLFTPIFYEASAKSRRRATYRFAKPQLIYNQWVFFANPRYRTLAHPKIRLITRKACSTFARTFDFVRVAGPLGLTQWPMASSFGLDEALGPGAWCRITSRCPL